LRRASCSIGCAFEDRWWSPELCIGVDEGLGVLRELVSCIPVFADEFKVSSSVGVQ
jgi:hypothetical protein